eukprot:gb/GECH01014273.1/.p1 GENE.gb/GECH01014273.1/~~gb/GECH01014273.1/.p1  ORF type:complete len:222 (+),score=57.02 gb/GECH01014273.1/:1-666(+)
MTSKIFIVRHGIREDWVNPQWDGGDLPHDPPLAAEGFRQAEEIAQFFNSQNHNIAHVFSSPYTRTLQTANAIAAGSYVSEVKLEAGIGEWFGSHAPALEPPPLEYLASLAAVDLSYESRMHAPYGNAETEEQLHIRAGTVLEHIVNDFLEDGNIVLVTHGATAIALSRALLNNPRLNVRTGAGSISVMEYSGVWDMTANGSTDHLSGGEQYNYALPSERAM